MMDEGNPQDGERRLSEHSIPLNRDVFLRTLLRHLAGTLQDVIGIDEASGFISIVGQEMGEQIGAMYREALAIDQLSTSQVADVLVDLKRRIHGDFFVIEQNADKIVLGNRACPFGDKVSDRPVLCMMTSNVFGSIASRERGYAKVELQETIARGDSGCRVVVHLRPTAEAQASSGREYHRGVDPE
jgi:predicted ArsR family transcriptional regulator